MQLSRQCALYRFARLKLSTGKLPQTALVDVVRTQADQDLSVRIGNRCYSNVQTTVPDAFSCGTRH